MIFTITYSCMLLVFAVAATRSLYMLFLESSGRYSKWDFAAAYIIMIFSGIAMHGLRCFRIVGAHFASASYLIMLACSIMLLFYFCFYWGKVDPVIRYIVRKLK